MSTITWFKSLSIRSKIFMLVILGIMGVTCISGFAKYSTVKKNTYTSVLKHSLMVETLMLQVMMAEEKFINTLDPKELSGLSDYRRRVDEALERIRSFDVGAGIGNEAAAMSQAEAEHARIFELAAQGLDEIEKAKADLFAKIELIDTRLKGVVAAIEREEALLNTTGDFLDSNKSALRKELSDLLVLMSDRIMNIQDLFLHGNLSKYQAARQAIEKGLELKTKNIGISISAAVDGKSTEVKAKAEAELGQPWKTAEPLLAEIARIEDNIFNLWNRNNDLKKTLQLTAVQIQEKSKSISETSNAVIESSNRSTDQISVAVSLGGIFMLSVLGWLISKSVNGALRKSITGLMEGAHQVASASDQVSKASQELADGASQQAASIEETTASLEEIFSMTTQNAENATQANQLMTDARHAVGKANQSMIELTGSMGQITRANLETQKIIKTIDEIAFQTNLLALNAAVEAARAGESGAGFAVVADEVRSLAMRAAQAAKNTADLIEGTVKTVKEGSTLVDTTNTEFNSVATTVSKSGELLNEIAAASKEQAQGIGQVSKAVAELEKVVQNNSVSMEESAAASEEMNAQSEQMKLIVADLVTLVGGATELYKKVALNKAAKEPMLVATYKNKANSRLKAGNGKDLVHLSKRSSGAEKVIPFDDGEVSDF